MASIELVERDFESFFEVPFRCYADDDAYVSMMKSDLRRYLSEENPLFRHHGRFTYFTARANGEPVGRIVAHIHDESNRLHGLERGYFGFFDSVDDVRVSNRLLGAAEEWLADRGCGEVAGNFNLTAMQQVGVVTDGFGRSPYTDMQYNPSYLPGLLESAGYRAFFPMRTWQTEVANVDPDRLLGPSQAAALESREIRWTRLRRRGFRRTLEEIRGLLNESFSYNPLFVPLSREEFEFQAKEMMWIMDRRITQLAYRGDELVGVVLCVPDLNPFIRRVRSRLGVTAPWHYARERARTKRAVVLLLGVRPALHGGGICGAMIYRLARDLEAAGYTHAGGTWIADENLPSLRQTERFGSKPLHRLHLFGKQLAS